METNMSKGSRRSVNGQHDECVKKKRMIPQARLSHVMRTILVTDYGQHCAKRKPAGI